MSNYFEAEMGVLQFFNEYFKMVKEDAERLTFRSSCEKYEKELEIVQNPFRIEAAIEKLRNINGKLHSDKCALQERKRLEELKRIQAKEERERNERLKAELTAQAEDLLLSEDESIQSILTEQIQHLSRCEKAFVEEQERRMRIVSQLLQ
ncbi:hypothetical protein FO519_003912 [Halicephalobus sp. NKZ332]|nr:hypothetical protein FO519_003912 [Halicephalobus sp. NKZ332]